MQLVIQIKNRIIIVSNPSVKRILHAKKIIFGILAHVFVRIASISNIFLMWQELREMELYILPIFCQQI